MKVIIAMSEAGNIEALCVISDDKKASERLAECNKANTEGLYRLLMMTPDLSEDVVNYIATENKELREITGGGQWKRT